MDVDPPWLDVFEVLDGDGQRATDQSLPLNQVDADRFRVGATLRYNGETGLDPAFDADVRLLTLDESRRSDLASVPAAMGWFETPHGAHTPAALFHDHLLDPSSGVTPQQADEVFRNMLRALRVPPVKRNLLWAAVAMRTRWVENRWPLVLWVVLSIAGLVSVVLALSGFDFPDWTGGRWVVLTVAALAPLPASLLWGKTRQAALIAAVMAIWILPAAVLAVIALIVYGVLEWIARRLRP